MKFKAKLAEVRELEMESNVRNYIYDLSESKSLNEWSLFNGLSRKESDRYASQSVGIPVFYKPSVDGIGAGLISVEDPDLQAILREYVDKGVQLGSSMADAVASGNLHAASVNILLNNIAGFANIVKRGKTKAFPHVPEIKDITKSAAEIIKKALPKLRGKKGEAFIKAATSKTVELILNACREGSIEGYNKQSDVWGNNPHRAAQREQEAQSNADAQRAAEEQAVQQEIDRHNEQVSSSFNTIYRTIDGLVNKYAGIQKEVIKGSVDFTGLNQYKRNLEEIISDLSEIKAQVETYKSDDKTSQNNKGLCDAILGKISTISSRINNFVKNTLAKRIEEKSTSDEEEPKKGNFDDRINASEENYLALDKRLNYFRGLYNRVTPLNQEQANYAIQELRSIVDFCGTEINENLPALKDEAEREGLNEIVRRIDILLSNYRDLLSNAKRRYNSYVEMYTTKKEGESEDKQQDEEDSLVDVEIPQDTEPEEDDKTHDIQELDTVPKWFGSVVDLGVKNIRSIENFKKSLDKNVNQGLENLYSAIDKRENPYKKGDMTKRLGMLKSYVSLINQYSNTAKSKHKKGLWDLQKQETARNLLKRSRARANKVWKRLKELAPEGYMIKESFAEEVLRYLISEAAQMEPQPAPMEQPGVTGIDAALGDMADAEPTQGAPQMDMPPEIGLPQEPVPGVSAGVEPQVQEEPQPEPQAKHDGKSFSKREINTAVKKALDISLDKIAKNVKNARGWPEKAGDKAIDITMARSREEILNNIKKGLNKDDIMEQAYKDILNSCKALLEKRAKADKAKAKAKAKDKAKAKAKDKAKEKAKAKDKKACKKPCKKEGLMHSLLGLTGANISEKKCSVKKKADKIVKKIAKKDKK